MSISDSDVIKEIRLAWGSVGPTVVTIPELEEFLRGKKFRKEIFFEAVAQVKEAVSPIDDVRAGAEYRRAVSAGLLKRLLQYSKSGLT